MYLNSRNIYQTARRAAGLTQEAAAERLGISVESIRAYETGLRMPPMDVADLMVDVYANQALAVQHLRASAVMARELLPEVHPKRLPEAVMGLVDKIYQFADLHRDRALIRIAQDGVIDEAERPEYDQITRELEGIIQAALDLRCAQGGGNELCR